MKYFRDWRERVCNFDDFVIKYLLFSHQNTFSPPLNTISEIENLVLNERNESNLGIENLCCMFMELMLNVSQSCLKQKMFVMKSWNYWNESIEKQNSILSSGKYYFTVIFCNFHNMNPQCCILSQCHLMNKLFQIHNGAF